MPDPWQTPYNPYQTDNYGNQEDPTRTPYIPSSDNISTGQVAYMKKGDQDPNTMPPPSTQASTSSGTGGGGGGGGTATTGTGPYPDWMSKSPTYNFEAAPDFAGPEFSAPTGETAWNDPGYQFRLRSGREALERGAAARGTLRTGGTLRDIMDYGQNFAAQEYGNIYNRALQDYNTKYQLAKDQFAPQFADWQSKREAEQQRANQEFARQWDLYALQNNLDLSKLGLASNLLGSAPE